MLKKVTVFSLLLALVSFPVFAQDDPEPVVEEEEGLPEGSIDVDLAFVSNYVFRGADIFQGRAQQKGESYGAHTGEWAFQPSVTFNGPSGMYFNFWGSFAMAGRKDQDIDNVIQTSPGGSDILAGISGPGEQYDAIYSAATTYTDPTTGLTAATGGEGLMLNTLAQKDTAGPLPGYYDEANGLERFDEIDLTIGYGAETSVGTIDFGIVSYTSPNSKTKGAFGDPFEEIYFGYALPFLPDLSLYVWTDLADSTNYYNLSYGGSFDISDGISLDYGAGVGYGVKSDLQGIQDITGSIGVTVFGFSVAYNVAVRPNLAFFDEDSGNNLGGEYWLFGQSSRGDGLVQDYSQTNGIVNSSINSTVGSFLAGTSGLSNYAYTPRQKLPTTLWWISVGYSFSI